MAVKRSRHPYFEFGRVVRSAEGSLSSGTLWVLYRHSDYGLGQSQARGTDYGNLIITGYGDPGPSHSLDALHSVRTIDRCAKFDLPGVFS